MGEKQENPAVALDREAAMRTLRAFGKAFNAGDADGVLAQVTDDFEWRLHAGPDAPDAGVVKGRVAVKAGDGSR